MVLVIFAYITYHKTKTATTHAAAALLTVTFILMRNAGDNTPHWRLRGEHRQGQKNGEQRGQNIAVK
jgi:hypothetical protein